MTDDLTPEQDAVRRLLAEARHDAPTPDEVVARLDDALASLVAERAGAPLPSADPIERHAVVVELGARRRRLAGIGLLAAAAVVVGGVALGQGLPSGSDGADTASAGDMATSQEDAPSDERDGDTFDSAGGAESQATSPQAKQATSVPTLSTADDDLDRELLRLESRAGARRSPLALSGAPDAFCLSGIGPGRRLAAEVDGQPGVVVYRPRSGDAQEVALYVCGDGEPVRTLVLPLP